MPRYYSYIDTTVGLGSTIHNDMVTNGAEYGVVPSIDIVARNITATGAFIGTLGNSNNLFEDIRVTGIATIGIVTGATYYGDGSNLTGVGTFSGSYNDLTNKPTIPTNNNELTNGAGFITTSFTNTNQLTNGAGFITDTVTGDLSVSGNVSIAGTLTYEDVTNIDSIGIVTARSGIEVGPTSGIGITLTANGSMTAAGSVAVGGQDLSLNTTNGVTAYSTGELYCQVASSRGDVGDVINVYKGNDRKFQVSADGSITAAGAIKLGDYDSSDNTKVGAVYGPTGGITLRSDLKTNGPAISIQGGTGTASQEVTLTLATDGSITAANYVTATGYNAEPANAADSGLSVKGPSTGTVFYVDGSGTTRIGPLAGSAPNITLKADGSITAAGQFFNKSDTDDGATNIYVNRDTTSADTGTFITCNKPNDGGQKFVVDADGSITAAGLINLGDKSTTAGGSTFYNDGRAYWRNDNSTVNVLRVFSGGYGDAFETFGVSKDGSITAAGGNFVLYTGGEIDNKQISCFNDPSDPDAGKGKVNGYHFQGISSTNVQTFEVLNESGSITAAGYVNGQGFNAEPAASGGQGLTVLNPDDGALAFEVRANERVSIGGDIASGSPNIELDGSDGSASFTGAVSKGSGSFKIDHPLPTKTETHHLVHSFIEGPQADLIYSGMVTLVAGRAEINLDTAARMTEGTFLLLNTNLRRFVSNEGGWTAVKSAITGNILTVEAQDNTCTDEVFWTVIGERKDQHMIDTEWTDENGRVITEPVKVTE